jgi:hypothetical protein
MERSVPHLLEPAQRPARASLTSTISTSDRKEAPPGARSEPALPDAVGPPALPARKQQSDTTAETRHPHDQ